MKNLKLWTLTFVIGIAGVFTTTNLPSNHSGKSKTSFENILLETTITNKTEIGDKNSFSKKNSFRLKNIMKTMGSYAHVRKQVFINNTI